MIISFMSMEDTPWDDGHHHSILLLEQHNLKSYQQVSTPSIVVVITSVPDSTHDVLYKGNLRNISPTIPLDISIKPGVVENVHIGASCSVGRLVVVIDVNPSHGFWTARLMKVFGHEGKCTCRYNTHGWIVYIMLFLVVCGTSHGSSWLRRNEFLKMTK
jgi:hypothetical protein